MSHYLISYDISNDRLRTKLANLLLQHGCERLQRSVFLAAHMALEDLNRLKEAVYSLFLQYTDQLIRPSVLCFPLKNRRTAQLVWAGDVGELQKKLEEVYFLIV